MDGAMKCLEPTKHWLMSSHVHTASLHLSKFFTQCMPPDDPSVGRLQRIKPMSKYLPARLDAQRETPDEVVGATDIVIPH